MTNKENMLAGKLYHVDKEIHKMFKESKQFQEEFNQTCYKDGVRRGQIIRQWFGKVGQNYFVQPPFFCDYGKNIEIDDNFFANYDCVFLDVCKIKIGRNVVMSPRVSLITATHPIDAAVRNTTYQLGAPITIGNDVWIGTGVIVNPGVTIGDNIVIGSGSVVTTDLESNAIYEGNPARKVRDITEEDKKYWTERLQNEVVD